VISAVREKNTIANMGITERKERQRKEVRESILNSAWQMVNEEGWQHLSIRKIADAIEYSVPVVYDHFENKEAILSEFNRKGFKLLGDKLIEAKEKHTVPTQQLEAIGFAYWDFAFQNKEYYQLMYGLGMPTCESLTQVPEINAFIGVIHSTIDEMLKANNPAHVETDTWLKVHSFWSMIHGLVSINLVAPPVSHLGMSQEEFNKAILKDVIKGFINGLKE
jgi:AcrR family transcriptional regulator